MRVLFVCLGNICRSPLAEAIFNAAVHRLDRKAHAYADSCGTANYHAGCMPDERAIAVAEKHGIELNHTARQITTNDIELVDYMLAMDHDNYNTITRLDGASLNRDKIFLMRHFDTDKTSDTVPDPYYGDEEDFQQVFDILARSVTGFLKYLERIRSV